MIRWQNKCRLAMDLPVVTVLSLVIKDRSPTTSQRANVRSIEWKHLMPYVKKEVQISASSWFTLLWDLQTGILEHYQERGVTIYGKHFSEMLHDRMKLMIQNKHEAQLKRHCPYTAAHIVEILQQLCFEVLEHTIQP
jgi:hypothetical protein